MILYKSHQVKAFSKWGHVFLFMMNHLLFLHFCVIINRNKYKKMKKGSDIQFSRIHTAFLFSVTLLLLGLFLWFLSPFLTTLFIAAILATVIYPFYNYLGTKKINRFFSAIIVFLLLILLFIVPVAFLLNSAINEATDVSISLLAYAKESAGGQISAIIERVPFILEKFPQLREVLTVENLATQIGTKIEVFSTAGNIFKNISFLFLQFFIFLFALFYFLTDGPRILKYIRNILPLPFTQNEELFKKIHDLMQSVIFGLFGGAVAQGVLLGVGLSLAGVDNPLFWALIGALFSPVPYIGVGIIWVPIVTWLYINQDWGHATFLLVWCIGLVANIDNVVKPYLIGAKSQLHPFAVMLAILGGVITFGFQGLIFGPFVLMLLLSFLHIYDIEYGKSSKRK